MHSNWGRVTHICVSKLTIIGSDNGLSPDRRQAIIWTNAGILLIGPLGTNFSEILIEILTFSFTKMCLKVSSAKRRPFCLGLNVLTTIKHNKAWSACIIRGKYSSYTASTRRNFCIRRNIVLMVLTWISNYINIELWDVISPPSLNSTVVKLNRRSSWNMDE